MSITISLVLIIFLILTLTCLFVPIRLQLVLNNRKRIITFRWLWIDLGSNLKEKVFELSLFNQTIIRKQFKKKEKIKKAKKKGRKLNVLDLWRKRDLLHQIIKITLRFFLDILNAIRWDKLFLEVDVATPDPALTGVLYGGLYAVKSSAYYFLPNAHVKIQPNFLNQSPRGSAETVFSIRLLNVVAPLSKIFFALPKIQMVKIFLISKRR